MARERRDVWVCDAPGCSVTRPDDGAAPDGYSGKVSQQGGSGVVNVPWFACKGGHITPAIKWVVEVAGEWARR